MAAAVVRPAPSRAVRRPRADARLDALMVAGCVWLSVGMAVDAWAHKNVPALETFFTPWHAVFYSGFAAVAAIVGAATWRNVRRGQPPGQAAPDVAPGGADDDGGDEAEARVEHGVPGGEERLE